MSTTEISLTTSKIGQLGYSSLLEALEAGHVQSIINYLKGNDCLEEKYFDLSHIVSTPTITTLELFNSCRDILKTEGGRRYIWEGIRIEASGVIAIKKFLPSVV